MISASDITKTYGTKANAYQALRGVSIKIEKGESVAIVGKSGSGKSTLMHLLAGLDSPSTGSIILDGTNLGKAKEKELASLRNERYGFIFQQFFLQPSLSVMENVALPLKIKGVSKRQRTKIATDVLKAVGMEDKARNRATDLSGGQKQRVAIARALVNTPDVIFADEPTGNLDSENGKIVTELLFKLHKDRGITLIIVTHDADLAKLCERTVHIQDGKISK